MKNMTVSYAPQLCKSVELNEIIVLTKVKRIYYVLVALAFTPPLTKREKIFVIEQIQEFGYPSVFCFCVALSIQ